MTLFPSLIAKKKVKPLRADAKIYQMWSKFILKPAEVVEADFSKENVLDAIDKAYGVFLMLPKKSDRKRLKIGLIK